MSESPRPDCEALLAHADWVRALARHLTADAHAADDLAQDALAAALVRPPPLDRPLRAWLGGVLRNLVRQARREAGHRGARERTAARAEAEASSAELLERLDSHRAVVEAVARLDEPYRATILMRYFEGLGPAAIARRTGTPLRTVHTRLARALARLRAELDRAHGGDRNAWLLALVPYARGGGGWSTAATGALVMETKLKIGVAALAVVGICSTLAFLRGARSEAAPERASAAPVRALAPPGRPGDGLAPREESASVERREVASTPLEKPAVPAPAGGLAGRVFDVEHLPVANLRLRYSAGGEEREAVSDAAGAFRLERPESSGTLDVASPGWTCLFRPELGPGRATRELVLVVAHSVTLAGVVVDEEGRGLASAAVAVPLPFEVRARFDAILDGASTVERATATGPDGRFELAGVPLAPELELVTTRPAFLEDRRPLPGYDELGLTIVLRRAQGGERLLGRVLDPAGDAVADAWVGLDEAVTKSGPDGEFALELAPGGEQEAHRLRALKQGFLPAELLLAPGAAWPQPLELVLGPPPLAITGRVVDERGRPLPGAEVWTEEETRFGSIPLGDGETSMRVGANVEGLLRGDPWTFRARAGSDGRFELAGLLPRDYRLLAFDRARMTLAAANVAAGTRGVELRMEAEDALALVAGRVTSLAGVPLAGVEVVLERPALGEGPARQLEGHAALTDADGRFAFERVARAVHALQVHGPELGLSGHRRLLGAGDDPARLELAVPLRVHVQIDAGPEAGLECAALLDASGTRLPLSVDHGQHAYVMQEIPLERGRSESFSVSETATTLVLLAGGEEVARLPLALVPGALNTVRP